MKNNKTMRYISFFSTISFCIAVFMIADERYIPAAIGFGAGTILMSLYAKMKKDL